MISGQPGPPGRWATMEKRLAVMGFASYQEYLRSPAWATRRDLWLAAHGNPGCFVCSTRPVQIHHAAYEHVGTERDDELVALCDRHHELTHALGGSSQLTLPNAHKLLASNSRFEELAQRLLNEHAAYARRAAERREKGYVPRRRGTQAAEQPEDDENSEPPF